MDLHEVKTSVRQVVARDLLPSLSDRVSRIGLSAILGSAASLTICGQFGIGLSGWANAFSSHIHESMSPWSCSVICGVLFAVFPVTVLRLLSSPMLFHVLFKKHYVEVYTLFTVLGGALAIFGHHGHEFFLFVIWMLAALATTWLASKLFEVIAPSFQISVPAFGKGMK